MITDYLNKRFRAVIDIEGLAQAGKTFVYTPELAAGYDIKAGLISGAVDPDSGHDPDYDISPHPSDPMAGKPGTANVVPIVAPKPVAPPPTLAPVLDEKPKGEGK